MTGHCASLLLLLGCACLAASLPRSRRDAGVISLPGGIPLEQLFSTCDAEDGNIGPCLAQLLSGAIDFARPNFTTGLRIKDDEDPIILDPFAVDDVKPKDREFQFGAQNILLHGMTGVKIENILFTPDRLELEVSFPFLSATGEISLKYLFITANPNVTITLNRLHVRVEANWTIDASNDNLYMLLSNATAHFDIGDFEIKIGKLASFGPFLEKLLNNNSEIVIDLFVPDLEKSVTKKLNGKLNRIKLRS